MRSTSYAPKAHAAELTEDEELNVCLAHMSLANNVDLVLPTATARAWSRRSTGIQTETGGGNCKTARRGRFSKSFPWWGLLTRGEPQCLPLGFGNVLEQCGGRYISQASNESALGSTKSSHKRR